MVKGVSHAAYDLQDSDVAERQVKAAEFLLNPLNVPVNIDVVTGGFPCQDFSLSGKRLGFDSHKNHYNKKNGRGNPTTEMVLFLQ